MLAPATLSAASLGAVLSYQKTAHGIAGRTATAEFSVDVYSPHIMRVRVTPQGSAAARRLCPDHGRSACFLAVQRGRRRSGRRAQDVEHHGRGRAATRPSHHVQGCQRHRHQRGSARQRARHDAHGQQDHRLQAIAERRALHRHGRAARESRPARDGDHAQEHGQLPVRRSQGSHVREHSLLHGTASRQGLRPLLQQLLSIRFQLRRVQSPLLVLQFRRRRAGPVFHVRCVGRQDPRALHLAHRADAAAAALEPRLPAVAVQLLSGKRR